MNQADAPDLIVAGAGPAGLATGLAAAALGLKTFVIGPPADPADGRTAALFQSSVQFLKAIGAWQFLEAKAERLDAIRLVDATGGLLRAPEVTFRASEIGLEAFGYNVSNSSLTQALEQAAAGCLRRVVSKGVANAVPSDGRTELTTIEGETFSAPLVAGADGRNSLIRRSAGIGTQAWTYQQAAVVCTFEHSRSHRGVSTELHRRAGPLTVVPMPGRQSGNASANISSLVWVETPGEAQRLAALDDAAFLIELGSHISGLLGTLSRVSPRKAFPLSGQTATVLAKNRCALIGEAGHVMPPIGAQGLNLSFRDAATLAELASDALSAGRDIGGDDVLAAYERQRRADVASRSWSIDLMNRSLLSEYTPVHLARGLGLTALKAIAPLRRALMREGVSPSFATPRLMRREGGGHALDGDSAQAASPDTLSPPESAPHA
jgi:2-octaprenyl-6-methoxyphenol hydroxylase